MNKIILLLIVVIAINACNSSNSNSDSFKGEEDAVLLANQMFEAIGGIEAWCGLKSLYIKAEHTEPQMNIPYQSEIWRSIDQFDVVIEQQNDSFHVKGVVNLQGGTIRYFDKRDTVRRLTAAQLNDWEFDHNHNVYVLLHDLACNPGAYNVQIEESGRLAFYQDSVFKTSFGLDDMQRPNIFYKPNSDGSVSGSIFTHWATDQGLTHSAGGHPLDSNFIYKTEIWQSSTRSLRDTFDKSVFEID